MLNSATEINRLPSNIEGQLHRVGDFFICSSFTEDLIGPRVVKIVDTIYYRFMKFIYLPQLPEKLTSEQVVEVCNLRLDYLSELVDHELNHQIVRAMAKYALSISKNIPSDLKVLDFGCGSGLSSQLLSEHLPNATIMGVDISEKAILYSQKQGLTALRSSMKSSLPFESATFDFVFAIFVMHFNIDMLSLVELRRVLQPSGQFIFNFRERDKGEIIEQPGILSVNRVIQHLEEAGFYIIQKLNHIPGISPSHIIISCKSNYSPKTIFNVKE